jgi:hypothetical protein
MTRLQPYHLYHHLYRLAVSSREIYNNNLSPTLDISFPHTVPPLPTLPYRSAGMKHLLHECRHTSKVRESIRIANEP